VAQQNIINAITGALVADAGAGGVNTLVGGLIYEDHAHENDELPFVIVSLLTDPPITYFGSGNEDVDADVLIKVYHKEELGAAVCRTIAERVYVLLHKQALIVTNHANGQMWCQDKGHPEKEEDATLIAQRWRFIASTA
jgi:hypothetical protein